MPSSEEKCLRCGKMVTYVPNADGEFCGECGWSREAGRQFAKSRLRDIRAHFTKSMVKAIGFAIVVLIVILIAYWKGRDSIRLASDGVSAIAEIQDVDVRSRRGRILYEYKIMYAGHTADWTSRSRYDVGTKFKVLYLPSYPSVWSCGDENDSAWSLANREFGVWGFIVAGCVFLWTGSRFVHHVRSGLRVLSQKYSFESEFTKTEEE